MTLKINYIKVLKANLIFVVLVFLPVLPVSSYLHEAAMGLHAFVDFSFFLSFLLIPFILLLGGVILLIVLIIRQFITKKKVFWEVNTTQAILLSFFVNYMICFVILGNGQIQKFEQNYTLINSGEKIVNALDDYYQTEEHYPLKLEELKPRYLDEIPKKSFPILSNFKYHNTGSGFKLSLETQCVWFRRTLSYNLKVNDYRKLVGAGT